MAHDPIVTRRFSACGESRHSRSTEKVFLYFCRNQPAVLQHPIRTIQGMGTNVLNLLQRTFGETSVHYRHFAEHYGKFSEWESEFEDCRSIFVAAREDYEGGYLFNVRALAKGKFSRTSLRNQKNFSTLATRTQLVSWLASRSIQTLKELSSKHSIVPGKVDRMNADLCKAGAYNITKQKQITAWADIGNKAAHGEGSTYTANDARAMVDGVDALVVDLL